MKVFLWLLAVLWPMAASGQTVFFDDFEGNTLLPHWQQPPASHWEYNVSNSMLNVTGLPFPGIPHAGSNFADTLALFSPQSDFEIDVWMGWEQGLPPHWLKMSVIGPGGNPILTDFGYSNDPGFGPNPVIFGGASGQGFNIPAPLPGMYQFTITRVAAEFRFYFDGVLFANFQDRFGTPAGGVQFSFIGPVSEPLGEFRIDRVRVVPAPGPVLVTILCGLAWACGRSGRVFSSYQGA